MLDDKKVKYMVLAGVTAILIAAPLIYLTMETSDEDRVEALIVVDGEEMRLEELKGMETVSGGASFQNRFGNWNEKADYEGVPLSSLVPDMERSEMLEVIASDGYSQKFSYGQIFPCETNKKIQGDIILAYRYNGQAVPDWEGGPMIAVLPPDAEFSNDDLNMTRSLDSQFNRQNSAGSLWVKNVYEINVIRDVYSDTEIGITLEGTTVHDYSFEELRNMESIEGEGTRIRSTTSISGPNTYRGVYLTELVSNIYSGPEYTLEVEARDGYTMTYPREHVEGNVPVLDEDYNETDIEPDFEAILAYEEDGEQVPDWERGPRIAFLNDEGHLSEAGLWAREVRYIRVLPEQADWTLELVKGSGTIDISKQYFKSAASCYYHRAEYEDDDYAGVTLWELIAAVDGGDPQDGHWSLNETLVDWGYEVEVIAEDGYSYTFDISDVAFNDTMILADRIDGEPLPEEDAPLRLVGEGLSGGQRFKNVVEIRLIGLEL